jgi:hypothetical protein
MEVKMKIVKMGEEVEIEKLEDVKRLSDWLNSLPSREFKAPGFQHLTKCLAPQIICKDGTKLSVQASNGHYCSPREDYPGYYNSVEVGFPSVAPPDSWESYFDGDWETGDRTDSVYGYIPIELVIEFIIEHGGIA